MTELLLQDQVVEQLADLIASKIKPKEIMNTEEAAQYLGVCRDTVTLAAKTGRLKSKNFGSGKNDHFRFKRQWLDEYMEE